MKIKRRKGKRRRGKSAFSSLSSFYCDGVLSPKKKMKFISFTLVIIGKSVCIVFTDANCHLELQ